MASLILLSQVFFLWSCKLWAGELTISPTVTLKETYNDNVYLTADQNRTSATITEVMPGIAIEDLGPSFKFKFNYAVDALNYSGQTHAQRANQLLNATSSAVFARELLFLDDSASVTQQNRTPFGATSPDNQTLSSNRIEVRTYSISPYLHTNFSQEATGELRFTRDSVDTSNSGLPNSNSNSVKAFLKNGRPHTELDWNVEYDDQKILYRDENPIEMQNTLASTAYHISNQYALTGSLGYEKNNYLALNGQKPEGTDWSVGVTWTPTERTSVALSGGRHYYGDTYTLAASERTFASVWSLGYNEGLMTTRSQFLLPSTGNAYDFLNTLWQASIPDPTKRQQAILAFLQNTGLPDSLTYPVNTITDQVFLQKNLQGSVALTGARNTVVLTLFDIRRIEQSASLTNTGNNNIFMLGNTRQTGGNMLWNWTVTPKTNATFADGYTKTISNTENITYNNNIITTALNHQLRPKLKATLELQHTHSRSSLADGNFHENLYSLMLMFSF